MSLLSWPQILVDEAVAAIDAMSREAMGETLRLVASSAGTVASLRSIEALGPLRAMLMPLPLPLEVISTLQPAVALSNEDRQVRQAGGQAVDTLQERLDV
jgi:aarF domain-containing kinase